MAELKRLIAAKTGIESEHQQLIYLSKYMQDKNTLEDYDTLEHESNIMLVMRLLGGASARKIGASLPRSNDECFITLENFKENGTVVLKMPCTHSICPDALMDYTWSEVSTHKKIEIKCPLCAADWPMEVIKSYGGASPTEMQQLELGISQNFCMNGDDIIQCPKCQSYCTRQNPNINSAKCISCSKKDPSCKYFCWKCLREWKESLTSKTCGNRQCSVYQQKLSELRTCGKTKVDYTHQMITKLRACPGCGTLIELDRGCKHMQCKMCRAEFCFVCLRMKTNGSWSCGSYNTQCEPAPIQTKI